jgi:Arc/MetJ-type ribon-helix-helix transcriptional regulator
MKVELSERAHQRIQELVEEGEYPSAKAALDAAVDLLDVPERVPTSEEIAAAAGRGRADFEAGRFSDGEEFAARLQARLASRHPQTGP